MENPIIRFAEPKDCKAILGLIKELAVYEKAGQEVEMDEATLIKDGFGEQPLFHVLVADHENEIKGISFYFIKYSTWKGKSIHLEDLIVAERFRGTGLGKLLFDATIKEAQKVNAKRLDWQVLDWNKSAIEFYKKLGADIDETWYSCRLNETEITHFFEKKATILP